MTKLLEVNNLTTRFHTFDGVVHALNGVSFDLSPGENLAVVGESGSGKSVTMMSLLRLLPEPPARIEGGRALFHDDGGAVDLLRLSPVEISRYRGGRIGFIFQDALSALNPVMTVGRQIEEAIVKHLGHARETARRRAVELLEMVGIPGAPQRVACYPHQFSGGMRQRVMIAVAIAASPKVVIADEPTTALDVTVQAQIVDLMKRLQAELKVAVIWVTHDLGVVAGMADRVLVMYAGAPVEIAPVELLYERAAHPYTAGLLGALPGMGKGRGRPLASIGGTPPDLLEKPVHCQFAWRCPHAFHRCWQAIPPLAAMGPSHQAACFWDLARNKPREVI